MILKKPYAFLIKYYRIIHLGLFVLLGFCAYKYSQIVAFFNEYVQNNYTITVVTNLEKTYTPAWLFIGVILIVALSSSILVLLHHKKNSYGLYLFMTIYYSVMLIGLFYLVTVFTSFETELLASTLSRSIRDILIIFYLPQFLFFVFIILRVVGFDVKKFDFSDVKDKFDSDFEDNEEVEINFNFDGHKTKQRINRFFRESVYYIKENKFVVICIIVAIIIFGGVYTYQNTHGNYDKNYSMGKAFIYNDLNITVEDAIVTNLDYNGNIIDNNYYYVLKMHVTNTSGNTINLDYTNFKLKIDEKIINPSMNMTRYFEDFASSNTSSTYAPKADRTFVLAYKVNEKDISNSAQLNIYTGSVYEKGEYLSSKILINIRAKKINDIEIVSNYSVGDTISFEKSFVGNTTLVIQNYIVDKSYVYKYSKCTSQDNCREYTNMITPPLSDNRHENKLIILTTEYSQDAEVSYADAYTSLQSFANHFVKIQYRVGDMVYSDNAINVTPIESDSLMIFEVPKNISDASIIQAIIVVRDKQYIVNLKM